MGFESVVSRPRFGYYLQARTLVRSYEFSYTEVAKLSATQRWLCTPLEPGQGPARFPSVRKCLIAPQVGRQDSCFQPFYAYLFAARNRKDQASRLTKISSELKCRLDILV